MDLDPGSSEKALRFVVAPGPTPASVGYASFLPPGEGQWAELCPEGMVVAKELAARVRDYGGVALVGDYGEEEGGHKHTLRVGENGDVNTTCDMYSSVWAQGFSQSGT